MGKRASFGRLAWSARIGGYAVASLLLMLTWALGGTLARASSRHALLIGISDYSSRQQGQALFPDLHCDEDVDRIETALKKTFNFTDANITRLTTSDQTTRAGILSALDNLISEVGPGDVIYIHYSGHGDQAPDAAKPTGLDYALVPCDYRATVERAYATQAKWETVTNEICGRTLGEYLRRLAAKGPAQITLSFDSCHSGEPTRGIERKRGISFEEENRWYQDHFHVSLPAPKAGAAPASEFADSGMPDDVVVLSACNGDESAIEMTDDGKDLGRFSGVLAQVLMAATPNMPYDQVYQKVRAIFHEKGFTDQDPQIDGRSDLRLLGGVAAPPSQAITVLGGANGAYVLDAGELSGVTLGSVYSIYPNGATTYDDTTRLADARVTGYDGEAQSDLALTRRYRASLKPENFAGAQAIEYKHNYVGRAIVLDAQSVRDAVPYGDELLEYIREQVRTVTTSGASADLKLEKVSTGAGPSRIVLERVDDGAQITQIPEINDRAKTESALCNAIRRVARYEYALGLENPVGETPAQIAFRTIAALPPTIDAQGRPHYAGDDSFKTGQDLHVNDWFTIEVSNKSDQQYHIALLDLVSTGDVQAIWPSPDYSGQDNVLPAHSTRRIWVEDNTGENALYRASAPDPSEFFKIVGTAGYVSYKALATRGASRGPDDPFSDLLGPAVDGGSRSISNDTFVAPASWATATMRVIIKP